ncbi:uncharacterized protein LOC124290072 [Haliotis rubra]|uniref:uncharacterized protein LOC124290072 n=1 Tax=Haliotis rubra TaxID=36100 RepID=UPI001EE52103|nr:uncharacterized protein LOC124290072 [Haliotis rubra]
MTASRHIKMQFTINLLAQLGWLVNHQKSELEPTQDLQFLGIRFLTLENRILVPDDRWQSIQSCIPDALNSPLDLRTWQQLLGLLTSAQALTRKGRLQLRPLQRFLIAHVDDVQKFAIPQHLKQYLLWWTVRSNVCGGTCLREPDYDLHLYVDASLQGWGAHLNDEVAHQPARTESSNRSSSTLGDAVKRSGPDDTHRQLHGGLLHKPARVHKISATASTDVPAVRHRRRNQPEDEGLPHPRGEERPSQRPIQTSTAISHRVEVTSRGVPVGNNITRPSPHRPVCNPFQPSGDNVCLSPVPDPLAWAVDALAISWEGMKTYAFLPPILLLQVLRKINQTRVLQLILNRGYSTRAAKAVTLALRRSTRNPYDDKWRSFDQYAVRQGFTARKVTHPQVADYLCLRSTRHLKGSTLSTHLAAISSVITMKTGVKLTKVPELVALLRSS